MKKLLLTGVMAVLLAGPAVSTESAKDTPLGNEYRCAWGKYIDNFKYVDERTAILTQGVNRKYQVTFLNPCRDLRHVEQIGVDATTSCLEKGDALIVRGAGGIRTRCVITDIVYLPKEEKDKASEAEGEESKE